MTCHDDSNLAVDARFSNQGGSMMSVVSHALMLPYIIVARLLDLAPFPTYAYVQLMAAPIGSAVVILRERTREGTDEVNGHPLDRR